MTEFESNQDNLNQDKLAADLEAAKQESKTRIDRLREIGQTAAAAAFAEIKEGSKELGTIAKDSFTTVAANLNSAASTASNSASNRTSNSESSIPSEEPIKPHPRLSTLLVNLYQALKEGFGSLDAKLSEQYGDRYHTAKQRLEESATWYSAKLEEAKATTPEPTPLEQKQNELAAKAESLGAFIAQKEQLIRQRLKDMAEMNVVRR